MDYAEFQVEYEKNAAAEFKAFLRRSQDELLADARAGRFGAHYQLWPAIAKRVPLLAAAPVLIEILRGQADYLNRYHAAAALLKLLNLTEPRAVDLAVAGREARIDSIELLIRQRLTPR